MKLLICPHNWFHQHEPNTSGIGGGEIYLHRLTQYLIKQGHEIKCIAACEHPYTHAGIEVTPQGEMAQIWTVNNDLFQWCDVIITQLIGTAYGCNKAQQHNKPIIFIAHNNAKSYPIKWQPQERAHIVYNSYQLRDDLFTTFGHYDGVVLHPLLAELPKQHGDCVTLINCNYNKGGNILVELARMMPHIKFQGVLGGYGEQITCDLPNVTYLPNGTDMVKVYANARILIVPSEFESYSQAAMEAMQCGIPVIAHPTPGLKENLADVGIFIDRKDINKYKETIVYLGNADVWRVHSNKMLARAEDIANKQAGELGKFNIWLSKIR